LEGRANCGQQYRIVPIAAPATPPIDIVSAKATFAVDTMSKRAQMWSTALSADKDFVKLGQSEQLHFMKNLRLSRDLDCAGFHPFQIFKWARGFTSQVTEEEMRQVVASLERQKWIAVDYDTEEVFVVPFIRLDSSRQPQISWPHAVPSRQRSRRDFAAERGNRSSSFIHRGLSTTRRSGLIPVTG
jgi:hypothetical protein